MDPQLKKLDIHKLIKVQKCIKKNLKELASLNDSMNITYNNIYSIMKRVNFSFLKSLITQYEYNSELNKLDSQLQKFHKLPRPFRLRNKNSFSMKSVSKILNSINSNLFDIASKTGTDAIFDAIYLKYNTSIKELFLNYEKKEKNLIYFFNHVFMSISIHIYELADINFDNKEESLVPYDKINKHNRKQYDMHNILQCDGKVRCFEMIKKNKSFLEKIQGARLYIPIMNENLGLQEYMVLDGYFLEDPLNISRIGGELELKNLDLLEKMQCVEINNYFKHAFVQQISIRDFLVHDNSKLVENCLLAFSQLQNLKKKNNFLFSQRVSY